MVFFGLQWLPLQHCEHSMPPDCLCLSFRAQALMRLASPLNASKFAKLQMSDQRHNGSQATVELCGEDGVCMCLLEQRLVNYGELLPHGSLLRQVHAETERVGGIRTEFPLAL